MKRHRPTVADLLASILRRVVKTYDSGWIDDEVIKDARRILKFYAGMKRARKAAK